MKRKCALHFSSYNKFSVRVLVIILIVPVNYYTVFADNTTSPLAPQNGSGSELEISGIQINVIPPIPMTNVRDGENLTIFELLLINKLQNFVEDLMSSRRFQDPFWTSPSFLISLLEASHWSMKSAKQNFRKAIKSRMKSMETMHEIPDPKLFEFFNIEPYGTDREGCRVVNVPVGEWNTYRSYLGKMKSVEKTNKNLQTYFRNVLHTLYNMVRTRSCPQIVVIADMKGYTKIHNSGIKFFIDSIRDFERSYPGMLKIAYLINSPPAFLKVANSFKTTVPWDLRRRTYIFTNQAFWEYPLNQIIDPSHLPTRLGGTNIFL